MHPSPEQKEIIKHVSSSPPSDTLVIAGPGSGKTRTLIESIVVLVRANPGVAERLVAISFTNNSAAELKVRLAHEAKDQDLPALHRVHVATFHAWVGQLAARKIEPWTHPPVGLKTAGLAVALGLKNPDSVSHIFTGRELSAADRHMEGSESFEVMERRNFNQIAAGGKNHNGFTHLKTAVEGLELAMEKVQLGTFGTLMKSGASLASILKSGEVAWLFIDEAQDINAPQAAFVAAVREATKCRVFAIADDDQGIYKFRGASSRFLEEFGSEADTTTFTLTENFRSTGAIVRACVNWIKPNWQELDRPKKALISKREGLPVVILNNPQASERGRHAKMIIDACKKAGLIRSLGEVAVLGNSATGNDFEIRDSNLSIHAISDQGLPKTVFKALIARLNHSEATGAWHHALWNEFLDDVTTDQKNEHEDSALGYPGLLDLYAAMEVFRRLHPVYSPKTVAETLNKLTRGFDSTDEADKSKFSFLGSRPDPDYAGNKVNYISFHSSKGMEFPVVWVTSAPYTFAPKDRDKEEGQPNLQEELGLWGKTVNFVKSMVPGGPAITEAERLGEVDAQNTRAARFENRRLLYVAMSRASDLLMISAPLPDLNEPWYSRKPAEEVERLKKKRQEADDRLADYEAALISVFEKGDKFYVVHDDSNANELAAIIKATHRNESWTAPKRYRVESYSSFTRQVIPDEKRDVEIPTEREWPVPPSEDAIIGDQFHRIMHLLCMKPDLIAPCLDNASNQAAVIATVCAGEPSQKLVNLLALYFSDERKPYDILQTGTCRSEVPFSVVAMDTSVNPPDEILVKGFLDLVQFDAGGNPMLILDYKSGTEPENDTPHQEQLEFYRGALAKSYSLKSNKISIVNYYVESQDWVVR